MRILGLEPYYAGSHRAFLDGWSSASRHAFTLLTLPGRSWKWRMRHASVTLADLASQRACRGERFDVIWCSDMLNLPEFIGLASPELASLPRIAYFHESQLAYPTRVDDPRDVHFALTNVTTALAATRVWLNSAFHRSSLLGALPCLLKPMPGRELDHAADRSAERSDIHPPGIDDDLLAGELPSARPGGPLRIVWAARWEHDKGPEEFFRAMHLLREAGVDFRLAVIGEQFRTRPAVFDRARGDLSDVIERWGYQPTRRDYVQALRQADVFVSTAGHEFFGIAAVEAAACGAVPVLPRRLAYPEVFPGDNAECAGGRLPHPAVFDQGGPEAVVSALQQWARAAAASEEFRRESSLAARAAAERYAWSVRAPEMDDAIEAFVRAAGR